MSICLSDLADAVVYGIAMPVSVEYEANIAIGIEDMVHHFVAGVRMLLSREILL